MTRRLAAALLSLSLAGCSLVGVRDDIEQPAYEVVASLADDIEIRQYGERVAAEATAAGPPGEARNAAFRLLFDYISGANEPGAEIAMTAPVETSAGSREIAMTAPVESSTDEDGATTMRFFLPARFTPETAPVPTDERVRLVVAPPQRLAVLTFSGSRSPEAVATKEHELRTALAAAGYDPAPEATAFFYDPPWTLPWLRRNEVAIGVPDS